MVRAIVGRFLMVTVPTIALCFTGSEIFFRTAAPACQAPLVVFDRPDRILRFDPLARTDGVFTFGRFARHRSHWHINREGWNSAVEYDSSSAVKRPLIAIIGDSYIEGLHVDVTRHIDAVLRSRIEPGGEVYAFGISGAPLSQYLLMSRYVARKFDPDVMVFVLVHNDFTQSIRELDEKPYFLQLRATPDSFSEVAPREYRSRPIRRLLSRSATVRFLILNAKLGALKPHDPLRRATVQDELKEVSERVNEVRGVTRYVLGRIRAENPSRRIVITMVPERIERDGESPNEAKAAWLHAFVREAAAECGCEYVDLDEVFSRRHIKEGVRFSFDEDAHWNALGHETAALAILSKLMEMGVVRDASAPHGPEIVQGSGPAPPESIPAFDASDGIPSGHVSAVAVR